MENILECRGLVKFFPNCLALNNVDLTVPKGRIVGLLGAERQREEHLD